MEIIELLKSAIFILSALGSAGAVLWAVQQYRLTKRDNFVAHVRNLLMQFKNNCNAMDDLLNYELVDEVVNSVVFSPKLHFSISSFIFSLPSNNNQEPKWPFLITTPAETPLHREYVMMMRHNNEICGNIAQILPSVYRIFQSVETMFSLQNSLIRNVSHKEDIYAEMVVDIRRSGTTDVNLIQNMLGERLMSLILRHLSKEQDNITDALHILEIVNGIFFGMEDRDLIKHIKRERKIRFKQMSETVSIFDDLQESEKGLGRIMSSDELMLFRELCVSIKIRNKKNNE